MEYKIIISESGQSLADIALQAYGSASTLALFALVDDNPAVFVDGISSLVPAGLPVKVREDATFADSQLASYFSGQVLNSGYTAGADIPVEGNNSDSDSYTFAIAGDEASVIVLHAAVTLASELFGITATILNSTDNLDWAGTVVSQSDYSILDKIAVSKEEGLIYITFQTDTVRYRVISVL